MKYFVIRWCSENNQFSVIPEKNLCDGAIRSNPLTSIGQEVKISWKGVDYDVELVDCGSKKEMDRKCDQLAESAFLEEASIEEAPTSEVLPRSPERIPANLRKKGRKRRRLENVLSKISTVDQPQSHVPESDWQALYEEEKAKNDALELKLGKVKDRYRKVKKELKEVKSESDERANVTIAEGVNIERGALTTAKLMSNGAPSLARNLFRIVFPKDELVGKSLFGKMCNANKGHPPLPSVDSTRRDAVIDHCLRSYGYCSDASGGKEAMLQFRCMKKEVVASLSKYIREVNRCMNEPRSDENMNV